MEQSSTTKQRIANILEGMRKAMPEIRRQVEVYEKSLQSGRSLKKPKISIHSRNV